MSYGCCENHNFEFIDFGAFKVLRVVFSGGMQSRNHVTFSGGDLFHFKLLLFPRTGSLELQTAVSSFTSGSVA